MFILREILSLSLKKLVGRKSLLGQPVVSWRSFPFGEGGGHSSWPLGLGTRMRVPRPGFLLLTSSQPPVLKPAHSCCISELRISGRYFHLAAQPWCNVLFTVDTWQIFFELTWWDGVPGRKNCCWRRAHMALSVLFSMEPKLTPQSALWIKAVVVCMEAILVCMPLGDILKPRTKVDFSSQ